MPEITCPRCNIQVPTTSKVCPFCKKPPTEPSEEQKAPPEIKQHLVPQENFSAFRDFFEQYGKLVKAAIFALFAVFVGWGLFLMLTGLSVQIPDDPIFPIKAKAVKNENGDIILKGTITNMGEDVQTLSLRSIRVTAEFKTGKGNPKKKQVYPTSLIRGEGALLRGETGVFEMEVPPESTVVTLRGEIVDLGEDRRFHIPGQRAPSSPNGD